MAVVIPLSAVPSQWFSIILDTQICQIGVYYKRTPSYMLSNGIYLDLYVNNALLIAGVICQNNNRIVRNSYLGFSGDLFFCDNGGLGRDPAWLGLGTDYSLIYLTAAELGEAVAA